LPALANGSAEIRATLRRYLLQVKVLKDKLARKGS